jgi:hypothetical protein
MNELHSINGIFYFIFLRREMLSSGSSLPWDKTLNLLTNQTFISSEYLLEYYKPLIKWLEVYNSENQNEIGWKSD